MPYYFEIGPVILTRGFIKVFPILYTEKTGIALWVHIFNGSIQCDQSLQRINQELVVPYYFEIDPVVIDKKIFKVFHILYTEKLSPRKSIFGCVT